MIVPSTYWGGELNRCEITTPNGVMRLSVPIYDSRRQQPVQDIRICYMHSWQRQHWSALFSAYGKTPYFDYYADYIRPLYEKQPTWLIDLNDETATILQALLSNCRPEELLTPAQPICHPRLLDLLMEYGPEARLRLD